MNFVFVLAQFVSKIVRSIFGFQKGGNAIEAKSVKKNEIPQKGQFNIMVGYGRKNSYDEVGEYKIKDLQYDYDRAMLVNSISPAPKIPSPCPSLFE